MDAFQCTECGYYRASRGALVHRSTVKCANCGVKGRWKKSEPQYRCVGCGDYRPSAGALVRSTSVTCGNCGLKGEWERVTTAVHSSKDTLAKYLLHLDLCIQAYQFYAQTLVWPLDPWYDRQSRLLSSRRDNLMAELYRVLEAGVPLAPREAPTEQEGDDFSQAPQGPEDTNYSSFPFRTFDNDIPVPNGLRGPGSTVKAKAKVSKELDPILTRYLQITPGKPAFQYVSGNTWIVFRLKGQLTDSVKGVFFCEYETKDAENPFASETTITQLASVDDDGSGDDVIYGFEGATGKCNDQAHPNWSMMGYVLSRKAAGNHDLHIVFRGSRSSSILRAAPNAAVKSEGNPDWVSDLVFQHDKMPLVSTKGEICRGFGRAIVSCLGTIKAACEAVQSERGTPDRIFVTGHSLGAALATAFVSSVRCGEFGEKKLSGAVKGWPWEDLQLLPISAPSVGDEDFRDWFHENVKNIHRFSVDGDVVTLSPVSCHVGNKIEFAHRDDLNPHEPMSVRTSLVHRFDSQAGSNTWGYTPSSASFDPPMQAVVGSFDDMLATLKPNDFRLKTTDLFSPHILADTLLLVRSLQRVYSYSSSYRGIIRDSEAQRRRDILEKFFRTETFEACKRAIEQGLFKEFEEAQPGLGRYLALLYATMVAKQHEHGYAGDRIDQIREISRDAAGVFSHAD